MCVGCTQVLEEQVEAELEEERRAAEAEQQAAKAAIDQKKQELQGLEAARVQAARLRSFLCLLHLEQCWEARTNAMSMHPHESGARGC